MKSRSKTETLKAFTVQPVPWASTARPGQPRLCRGGATFPRTRMIGVFQTRLTDVQVPPLGRSDPTKAACTSPSSLPPSPSSLPPSPSPSLPPPSSPLSFPPPCLVLPSLPPSLSSVSPGKPRKTRAVQIPRLAKPRAKHPARIYIRSQPPDALARTPSPGELGVRPDRLAAVRRSTQNPDERGNAFFPRSLKNVFQINWHPEAQMIRARLFPHEPSEGKEK